jgi:hypothetical protein
MDISELALTSSVPLCSELAFSSQLSEPVQFRRSLVFGL